MFSSNTGEITPEYLHSQQNLGFQLLVSEALSFEVFIFGHSPKRKSPRARPRLYAEYERHFLKSVADVILG